ncbi:hypothetical protein [Fuerstiella marisgermanici]|uniref:Uncharacterized protein n=1 Tax=Fuerstiella marisgermanici TaxID=1891926 RepID=A0A1P8WQH3_9PLAN|nr:hypothetical protein [Fuerstiella marisgermanici]APZ96302.1 hypothetical protein Fuma_05970 [Fuerstiella marisgermanici]
MAKRSLVPTSEGKFSLWIRTLAKILLANPELYGLTEAQVTKLSELVAQWDEDYEAAERARDIARGAVEKRKETRRVLTEEARMLARLVQANPNVTDEARRDAGLPVHKTHRTPASTPKSAPMCQVIATDRLEHMVSYVDSLTPTRRAKPDGVASCQIYVAIGDAAPNASDYVLAGVATRTPHKVTFKEDDGGKTAHYLLRWANAKGDTGPWSHGVSATIPAV